MTGPGLAPPMAALGDESLNLRKRKDRSAGQDPSAFGLYLAPDDR
jgi:hypothetical protein